MLDWFNFPLNSQVAQKEPGNLLPVSCLCEIH